MVGQRIDPVASSGRAELLNRAVDMVNEAVALLNQAIGEIKQGEIGDEVKDDRDAPGASDGNTEQSG